VLVVNVVEDGEIFILADSSCEEFLHHSLLELRALPSFASKEAISESMSQSM